MIPFFSVIVPVYDCRDTLADCVESVLSQGMQSVELLLMDDGSRDGSAEICDHYAAKYPRLVFSYHGQNCGPLAARLKGIEHARGSYLLFLDGDDRFLPGTLQTLYDTLQQNPLDLIIFNHSCRYPDGHTKVNLPVYPDRSVFTGGALSDAFSRTVFENSFNAVWQKCVKRAALPDLDALEAYDRLCIGEDKLLSLQIMQVVHSACYLSAPLYEYRLGEGSLSHKLGFQHYCEMSSVYDYIHGQLPGWDLFDAKNRLQKNQLEFAISCLYALAERKEYHEFYRLSAYIKSQSQYRNAYAMAAVYLNVKKRMACFLLQNGMDRCLLLYIRSYLTIKKLLVSGRGKNQKYRRFE